MSDETTRTTTPDAPATGAAQAAVIDVLKQHGIESLDALKALTGRMGTAEERAGKAEAELKKFRDAETAAKEQEALKRGEHEKVITELRKESEGLKAYRERLQKELEAQWAAVADTVPKDDDRFKSIFREVKKESALDDLDHNLTEFRKLQKLGVFTPPDPSKP
ncbi:hypothetical protein GX586_16075, partial [bacterium]|nr:hypothetical protein [bacterium]